MRAFLSKLFLFLASLLLFSASLSAQKSTYRSGNWGDDCVWGTILLLLCNGSVPDLLDNVTISENDEIVVNGNYTCNNLTLDDNSGLTSISIPSGNSLTVNGNLTLLNADLTYNGDIYNSVKNYVNVLGTLTVKGDIIITNNSYYSGGTVRISQALINVGSEFFSGTLNVEGDIVMTAPESHASTIFNYIIVKNGDLNIDGDVTMGLITESDDAGINYIGINDSYSTDKTINFNSNSLDITRYQGTINVYSETGDQTDCIFNYNGTGNQTLDLDSDFEYGVVNFPNADTILLSENSSSAQIINEFTIKSGQVLKLDAASENLDNAASATNFSLKLESGATLLLENGAMEDGIPAQKLDAHSNSTIIYRNTTGTTYNILTEELQSGGSSFPTIKLLGSGVKYLSSSSLSFDGVTNKVEHIELEEGTLAIQEGVSITMTDTYLDKTLAVNSNTTLQVEGDFTYDFHLDLDRNSTVEYNKSGLSQTVYSFTSDGTTIEPYGKLLLSSASGASTKNVLGDVHVEKSLQLGDSVVLAINDGGYTTLLGDSSYTAYLKEVPASASISYAGNAKFIVQKFIGTGGNYSSIDITTPIKDLTFANWSNTLSLSGIPGLTESGFSNIVSYNESMIGTSDKGFEIPDTVTNPIYTYNGSNIVQNAFRHNIGTVSRNLADSGQVNYGTQTFELSFTYSGDTVTNARTNHDGWHIIGNPYPSAISWEKVVADPDNAALFSGGFIEDVLYTYKYNDREAVDSAASTSYGYYNAATNFEYAQDSIIPPHQAFLVKTYHSTENSQTYTLKIKESHKVDYETATNYKSENKNIEAARDNALGIYLEGIWNVEPIWLHGWSKATTAIDEAYDVRRVTSLKENQSWVNFKGAESSIDSALNLYVNAIEENKVSTSVELIAHLTAAQEYSLRLANFEKFSNGAFGCIMLEHVEEGSIFSITKDTVYTFTASSAGMQHFILHFNANLTDFISTKDVTCFGDNDGEVSFAADKFQEDYSFTLFKDGEEVNQYQNMAFLEEGLAPGGYELRNDSGSISCTSNLYSFEITQPDELEGEISSIGATPTVGDTIELSAINSNGAYFTWFVNSDEYAGVSVQHIIADTVNYVELLIQDSTLNCLVQRDTLITAEEAVGIAELNGEKLFDYEIKADKLYLSNLKEGYTVQHFNNQGQLLKTEQRSAVNTQPIQLEKGLSIITFTNNQGERFAVKVALQ